MNPVRNGASEDVPSGAVEKAALVLEAFPPGRTALGVTELARRCRLPKSTTHRILQILETIGMVERQETGYLLGARIRLLADTYDGRSPSQLRNCVLPYLLDLYEATHLTVHLGVWSGGRVLIVENLHGRTAAMTFPEAGSLVPAHCTALGRVLLAHAGEYARLRALRGGLRSYTPETVVSPVLLARELEGVHRLGVAHTANQFLPGMTDVAAPIVDAGRSVVAAVSVSGPTGRFDGEDVSRLVRHAAREASLSPCLRGASRPVRRLERPDGVLQSV
ncbi:HTH-type transcriptional regulator XynR [Streptomyces sp. enrichment culture]|uniref:IclR family transcriptional regulator n=1 Tax=Streptomyces sp. enrichment culture TaxID=1795815 RepID=UPI003F563562